MPKNGSGLSQNALYDLLHQHLADNHYNKTETDDLIDAINAFHYMGLFDATQDTLPESTENNAGNYYLCTVGGTYETVDLAIGIC